jgi:hypothetical protein
VELSLRASASFASLVIVPAAAIQPSLVDVCYRQQPQSELRIRWRLQRNVVRRVCFSTAA